MLVIDGSQGEGGGQILRTSLALSLVTQRPIRIERIRAGRRKPGLRAQHLTCVEAAQRVGGAEIQGAALHSQTLSFRPSGLFPVDLRLDLGTAGSTSLVLQTVLPALVAASGPSRIELKGGTHNPLAPPFEFLTQVYLPLLERMGPRVEARLERHGFYPKGGGRVVYEIRPSERLAPLTLLERGALTGRRARALVSQLPDHVGERELKVVAQGLGWTEKSLVLERVGRPRGPGNALLLELTCEHVTEVVTSMGERGVPAEQVAQRAVDEARRFLEADVPVGEHLADQLLLLQSLAGGGRFRTLAPSGHTTTQIDLIPRFLDVSIESRDLGEGRHELAVEKT